METLPLDEVAQTVRPWIRMPEPPDTVILGCTHFPLLIEELEKVLPNGTLDSLIQVLQSPEEPFGSLIIKKKSPIQRKKTSHIAY